MADLRYAIVGSGSMGHEHIDNINALDGGYVAAIVDPFEPSRDSGVAAAPGARPFSTHHELLEWGQFDAAVVVVPNYLHHGVLMDLIRADVHFMTEKPMCTTVADCEEVIAASADSDRVHWMGLEYRYMPTVARVLNEVSDGAAGDVRMVSIREHRLPFLTKVGDWNRFRANTGGTLVEKCCHFFDLMNLVAGDRPVRVMASGAQDVNHLDEVYDGQRSDIMDNAYVIVEYANGVRGMLDLSMFGEGSRWEQEIAVVGSKGKVESFVPPPYVEGLGEVRISDRTNGIMFEGPVGDARIKNIGGHHGASYIEHLHFRDAIVDGTPALVTLEEGLWSVAVGAAAHRSIDQGRVVEVAELLGR